MFLKFTKITIVWLLFTSNGWAVQPYEPVLLDPLQESWRWRSFPELAGQGLRCLDETKDGTLWFGVDAGVVSFDGINWTTYTPKNGLLGAPVKELCATQDGTLYAGTDRGISQYRDGQWKVIFPQQGDLPWNISGLTIAPDHSLWAATVWGGLHIKNGVNTLYTTPEIAKALKPVMPELSFFILPNQALPRRSWSNGSGIWASGGSRRIRISPVPIVVLAVAPNGPAAQKGVQVGDHILNIVSRDELHDELGTQAHLEIKRSGSSDSVQKTIIRAQTPGYTHDFSTYDIFQDRSGHIWFGLMDGDIVCYDPSQTDSSSAWTLYNQGLDIGPSPRITQTQDGAIWICSDYHDTGINRFDGKNWTTIKVANLSFSPLNTDILETKNGALWIAGGGSLSIYTNKQWAVYTSLEIPVSLSRSRLIQASNGAIWYANRGGEASRLDYNTAKWTTFKDLIFQCESVDGTSWFIEQRGDVIRSKGRSWSKYGPEDGLIDAPVRIFATSRGETWAVGSHDSTAATAQFNGKSWHKELHPKLSWGLDDRAIYETKDGTLWFSATVNQRPERGHIGGILRYGTTPSGSRIWTHDPPPNAPPNVYGFGETSDGIIWGGGAHGLRKFDGKNWSSPQVEVLKAVPCDVLYTTSSGELWVSTRKYGIFVYNAGIWKQYDISDGLADNRTTDILQRDDGMMLAVAGVKGTSGFDGQYWTRNVLPLMLSNMTIPLVWLRKSKSEALWFNYIKEQWTSRASPGASRMNLEAYAIRYVPDQLAPETNITVSFDQVGQPGNAAIFWEGKDVWRETHEEQLQYAHRLNGGEWTRFSTQQNVYLESLPTGKNTFEVKARDLDLNEDPTPAAIHFSVTPPIWQQPWFVALVFIMLSGVGFQTIRIIRRDRKLLTANIELEAARESLEQRVTERTADLETRNAELERFTYTVSHDLKSPLVTIRGFLGLLKKDALAGDRARMEGDIEQIDNAAGSMSELLDDLLELSRIGRIVNPNEEISLEALSKQVVNLLKPQAEERSIQITIAPNLPSIYGDRLRLQEVLQNLIENAIKFCRDTANPHIEIGHRSENGQELCFVKDNGIGIEPQYHEKVFGLFERLDDSKEGTDIGLALVKRIVELHGGTVWVESKGAGKGTTFCFTLPSKKIS